MDYIENRTFDEIQIGEAASLTRTLTKEDIQLFAIMSGDISPIHMDEEYAKRSSSNKYSYFFGYKGVDLFRSNVSTIT